MREKEEIIAMLVTVSQCNPNDEHPCMNYDDCACTIDDCIEHWKKWLKKDFEKDETRLHGKGFEEVSR